MNPLLIIIMIILVHQTSVPQVLQDNLVNSRHLMMKKNIASMKNLNTMILYLTVSLKKLNLWFRQSKKKMIAASSTGTVGAVERHTMIDDDLTSLISCDFN